MTKIIIAIFLSFLFFFNTALAESYYFKNCKLTDILVANYLINVDAKTITVNFEAADGTFQEFDDEIESIQKDKIVSKKIKSGKSQDSFFIYYLDSNSNSVIKQNYKKEVGLGIFRPLGPKKKSYCSEVKSDWDVSKIEVTEINKEQEEILKIQKKILSRQKTNIKCKGENYKAWTGCVGKYTNNKSFIYIGKFENGKIIDGTILYPGGSKYSGTFQNNKQHGQGTFIYSDGTKYYGEWKEGKISGNGTKTWRDGRKYSGSFKNERLHGNGTFYYSDGSKYVGEWKDGKRHGKGTLTYADGQTYVGSFAAGLPYGDGLCMDQSGSSNPCTLLETKENKSKLKNRHSIKMEAKKWVKISEYENTSGKAKKFMDKLKNDFDARASELCSSKGNFDILEKRIEILAIDETPAIGTETVIKMGIVGVVACKKI